ncbi:MAG TPA: SPFH domain-containing protein [Dehalococcoidia bacterium]|nr:SPFH domain-containing protein [Dehalococcoidia bacterium]
MEGILIPVTLAVIFVFFLWSTLKIIRPYQRLVVFRLGQYVGSRGPGPVLLIPFMELGVWVDLRETLTEVPHQTCITKDNAPIDIDFLIYSQVLDPSATVIRAANFAAMARGIATTTLRAVIGDIALDDALAKREEINQILRLKLDEATEPWGVKVTRVEIREINPPREIQAAMNRQMSAERERRATVIEAEGKRQATITVAEGDKQSAILRAEGERQAVILRAEAERQANILRAEGFSLALDRIFSVAQTVDPKTMTLQYFETLKALGASPATKFVFPMEFTNLLGNIGIGLRDGGDRERGAGTGGAGS